MANKIILALLISITLSPASFAQKRPIPPATLLEIVKAEDERRWDDSLRNLLSSSNPLTRKRAALATGRIGNEDSVSALTNLLENDADMSVRSMAAFALGEIESETAANALLAVLKNTSSPVEVRARAMEALGKIAAALPREQEARQRELGAAISDSLNSAADQSLILFGLTAALRSRPANAGPVIAKFLTHSNPRVRADAGNALARLRLKDGNDQLRRLVASDVDPIVRANAARVLGITEDKQAYEALLARAIEDSDSRVRVSAIRALASLKDPRAAKPLLKRVEIPAERKLSGRPAEVNELLEIATTLGRLLAQQEDQAAITSLRKINEPLNHTAPEVELALVRIAPAAYLAEFGTGDQAKRKVQETILLDWRAAAGIAAALGEIAALPDSVTNKSELAATAQSLLRAMLDYRNSGLTINTLVAVHSEYAIADVLRALAAFKPQDLATVARVQLKESDVVVRGTAADLLGDLPPSQEITAALGAAWPQAANDVLNDAALSILDSLGKQKTTAANDLIKEALKSGDLLVRRRAVTLLKANGAGDFSSQIGTVHTRNTEADYKRALARIGKPTRAVVTTSKGSFTIDLLPEAAPLTVDNFVQLAQRDYYRNITIHRVVPNFVIQDGDPRGDGNGGPGYQIRCEINQVLYDRATVGMALSGKDTGGSQWFVTHSPQPHLDGGYTVFGRVVTGMDVVDRIVRGDVIQTVVIKQGTTGRRRQL
ncbi:MAG TPA: HEAT repeat domain-containing protein [Pyrinomonadaceae bacterium]|nr:HEAT repeat domain-containing protein [Pyrinomonadaceae bacterium]